MEPTVQQVKETIHFDTVSKKDGVFTCRKEFFYRHDRSAEKYAAEVLKAFPNAVIIETAEIWKPFRGGASTRNSSHFLVRFSVKA